MATISVASITQFNNALSSADPGDVISCAAGTYDFGNDSGQTSVQNITKASPFVTITSANLNNKAVLKGLGWLNVEGFKFKDLVFRGTASGDGAGVNNILRCRKLDFYDVLFDGFGACSLNIRGNASGFTEDISLRYCTFKRNKTNYLFLGACRRILMEHCEFLTSTGSPDLHRDFFQHLNVSDTNNRGTGELTVEYCFFTDNQRMGMWHGPTNGTSGPRGPITLHNNYFDSNGPNCPGGSSSCAITSMTIDSNIWRHRVNAGVGGAPGPKFQQLRPTNCTVRRNITEYNLSIPSGQGGWTFSGNINSSTAIPSDWDDFDYGVGGANATNFVASAPVSNRDGGGGDPTPDPPIQLTNAALHGAISGTFFAGNFETGGGDTAQHPRTVFNSTEFANIDAKVTANQAPHAGAWTKVLAAANDGLNFTPSIQAEYGFDTSDDEDPSDSVARARDHFWKSSTPMYACALAWKRTGDNRYASKAIGLLDAWATRAPKMVGNTAHPGLHISSFMVEFLYTVDLLNNYSGLPAIRNRLETWLRRECLAMARRVIEEKMPPVSGTRTENNTPSSNWLDAAINFTLAFGIAFDDVSLQNEMVGRLGEYFEGVWRIKKRPYGQGGAQVATITKDVDRDMNTSNPKGASYTGYGSCSLVQALEMARYLGTNLINEKTSENVGYQEVIQTWWDWTWGGVPLNGKTSFEKETRMHNNLLEFAYRHYFSSMSNGFKNFVTNNRPIVSGPRDDFPTFTRPS